MSRIQPSKLLPLGVATLILGGLIVSGYLFTRSILLVSGRADASLDVCSMLLKANCEATLLSQSSHFLGIPIAGWGMVYFGGLGALLFLGYLFGRPFARQALIGGLLASAGGLGVSFYLAGLMLSRTVPFCPLCIVVHSFNLMLFLMLYLMIQDTPGGISASIGAGLAFVFTGRKPGTAGNPGLNILGYFASMLVALVLYQWVLVRFERATADAALNPRPDQILKVYLLSPRVSVPVGTDDPRLGETGAPIQVVVFSDFQCAGCKLFAARAQELMKKFPSLVSIVFKHFPLDKSCNSALKETIHDVACRAALDAEAARRAGKFWDFHAAVYERDEGLTSTVLAGIEADLNLPMAGDGSNPGDASRVQEDIKSALQIGINSTPAVFINGRRVVDPSPRALDIIATYNMGLWMESTKKTPRSAQAAAP